MARPRGDIQPRILHAARARFLADGVDGASLRHIARGAKTSIGMVYYYYPTKDALFLAVVEEVYAKLLTDLEESLSADVTLRERLGRAFARLGRASEDELQVIRLIVREALVSSERFRAVLARFRTGHVAALLRAFAEGARGGEIDDIPLPVLLVVTLGIGGVPQIIRRVAGKELPFAMLPDADALANVALGILFDGIARKKTPAKPPKAVKKRRVR